MTAALPPPSRVQLEVLVQYVEGGLTVAELARQRGTSPENIGDRLHQARRRLGASTSAQAYAIAVHKGLIRARKPDPVPEKGDSLS